MDLKILHTADLHLDSAFSSFAPDTQKWLKSIQRTIPEKLLEISKRENCNMWLIAGDLFDGQQYTRESLAVLRKTFEKCGVPVFISPGNHDYFSSESPWAREKWPENVYIFKSSVEAVSVPELDCIVYGAGFQSMDSESLLSSFHALREAEHEIMVMHGDPIRAKSPYNAVTSEQVLHSGLDYIALGHVHARGSFVSGGTICAWPGCPMGRGWDETGTKGVYIVTLNSGVTCKFLPLDMPVFHDAVLSGDSEIQNYIQSMNPYDYYRLMLTGKRTGKTTQLADSILPYSNVYLIDKTIAATNPWDMLDEDSFKGNYFRILKDRLHDSTESEAKVINLAAEIASDILNGIEVEIP